MTRLAEYARSCGAAESEMTGLTQLVQVERELFTSVDTLRKLHREATTHQEALIRVDRLPRGLESAASLADVEAGYRAGRAEVATHGPLSPKGCETVKQALAQGNALATAAAEQIRPQQQRMHEVISKLDDALRVQRQAAAKATSKAR